MRSLRQMGQEKLSIRNHEGCLLLLVDGADNFVDYPHSNAF
jgi:hypothetical protein